MKIWTILGICVLMLSGCTSVEYQKMQAERDQLLKNYEDLREEHNELKIKTDVIDTLLGKWKFLNLEVEESNVSEEIAETKAALYALDLKNLTLEFFEEKGTYNYRGENRNTEVSGQFGKNRDHSPFGTATNRSPSFGSSDALVQKFHNSSSQQVPMGNLSVCQVLEGLTQRERLVFQLRRTGYISRCTARCN